MDSWLLSKGASFSRGQAGVPLKPALWRRLRRFTGLIVIALVSIGVWVAAIWTAFAILGLGA